MDRLVAIQTPKYPSKKKKKKKAQPTPRETRKTRPPLENLDDDRTSVLATLPPFLLTVVLEYLASPDDPRPALRFMRTGRTMKCAVTRLLTRVNMDVVPFHLGLRYLRIYARARASLTHLVLRGNEIELPLFFAYLLETCDISGLTDIKLHRATYKGMAYTRNVIQDDGLASVWNVVMQNKDTTPLAFQHFVGWMVPETYDLRDSFRRLPSKITDLGLSSSYLGATDIFYLVGFSGMASIDTLDIIFNLDHYNHVRDVADQIRRLPSLRVLRLRRICDGGDLVLHLTSRSLQILDVRGCGPAFSLASVDCPRLLELHVEDRGGNGNGVRRLGFNNRGVVTEFPDLSMHSDPVRIPARGHSWMPYTRSCNDNGSRVLLPDDSVVVFYSS